MCDFDVFVGYKLCKTYVRWISTEEIYKYQAHIRGVSHVMALCILWCEHCIGIQAHAHTNWAKQVERWQGWFWKTPGFELRNHRVYWTQGIIHRVNSWPPSLVQVQRICFWPRWYVNARSTCSSSQSKCCFLWILTHVCHVFVMCPYVPAESCFSFVSHWGSCSKCYAIDCFGTYCWRSCSKCYAAYFTQNSLVCGGGGGGDSVVVVPAVRRRCCSFQIISIFKEMPWQVNHAARPAHKTGKYPSFATARSSPSRSCSHTSCGAAASLNIWYNSCAKKKAGLVWPTKLEQTFWDWNFLPWTAKRPQCLPLYSWATVNRQARSRRPPSAIANQSFLCCILTLRHCYLRPQNRLGKSHTIPWDAM